VVHHIQQLLCLSLTHLELLVPLMQLNLEVVDVVLREVQLTMSVLQLCMGVVKGFGLEVMAALCHHQLVVQLLDVHLESVVLLE
jgi:hypothetical protein